MSNNRGFKAEMIRKAVINNVLSVFKMTAHADEVGNSTTSNAQTTATPTPAPQINYEQLIAQARKEEKDKLYGRISKLEEEQKKSVENANNYLIKIGDLTKAVENLTAENEKLKSGSEDSQIVKDLKKQVADLEAENKKLKESSATEEEIEKKIRAEYELKSYIAEQKTAHKDEILTTFLDTITGTSNEEVDKAVQEAINKTTSIKKDLGLLDSEGKPVAKNTAKKAEKKESVPKVNPSATTGGDNQKFDAEYIRNLDPNSEEYKEFRKSLGLK